MNCCLTFIFYRMGLFIDTLSCLDYTESVICELISEENLWNYVDKGKSVKSVPISQTQITRAKGWDCARACMTTAPAPAVLFINNIFKIMALP
jgi:hypothetical protein